MLRFIVIIRSVAINNYIYTHVLYIRLLYSIGYCVLDKLLFFVKKIILKYSSHSILHSPSEKDEKLEKTQSYNGLNAENTYIDVL